MAKPRRNLVKLIAASLLDGLTPLQVPGINAIRVVVAESAVLDLMAACLGLTGFGSCNDSEQTGHYGYTDQVEQPHTPSFEDFRHATLRHRCSQYATAAENRSAANRAGFFYELVLIGAHWQEGRVEADQARRTEAAGILTHARTEFVDRGIGYNAALVSMELAVLHLEEGRTGEVKTLAREMAPIFQAQGVHRETLAALRLFCEAAEREAVTLELARRLVHYLERARLDPGLRFDLATGLPPG
jgi:hypothetical protein